MLDTYSNSITMVVMVLDANVITVRSGYSEERVFDKVHNAHGPGFSLAVTNRTQINKATINENENGLPSRLDFYTKNTLLTLS